MKFDDQALNTGRSISSPHAAVLGSDAFFQLSGSIHPGAVDNNTRFSSGRFSLDQRSCANQIFHFNIPDPMTASGVLAAGKRYRWAQAGDSIQRQPAPSRAQGPIAGSRFNLPCNMATSAVN